MVLVVRIPHLKEYYNNMYLLSVIAMFFTLGRQHYLMWERSRVLNEFKVNQGKLEMYNMFMSTIVKEGKKELINASSKKV